MSEFNNVLNLEDRIGFAVTLEEVANFRQCVRDSCLLEIGVRSPFFTWSIWQEGSSRFARTLVGYFVMMSGFKG